jgi:hypothetical protein
MNNDNSNNNNNKLNKNNILKELVNKQRNNINNQEKLNLSDITRISNNLDSSIFNNDECCIWKGYITNKNNNNRPKYINFFFNNKKVALHRLLYINYVDNLDKKEYLKYSCKNKGICCNLNHIYKNSKKIKKKKEKVIEIKDNETINTNNNIVSFD